MSLTIGDLFPSGWRDCISADHPRIGMGLDLGTTQKGTSNPSALAIVQQVGPTYVMRLGLKWKTNRPDVTRAILEDALGLPHGFRARRLCVDATSERFFATDLRSALVSKVPVELVVSSESIQVKGEKLSYKVYTSNLLINAVDDGYFAIPDLSWVEKDFRQVVRDRGTFHADVADDGSHADLFDAARLALYALVSRSGPANASGTAVGHGISTSGARRPPRVSIRNVRRLS